MNVMTEAQQTPTSDASPAPRMAYVPPKLELLDTRETLLNLILPVGDDGIFYS